MTRSDAQKSTSAGSGVTVTRQTVPRCTESPVFRLLDQPSTGGVDTHGWVDADTEATADRLPAASNASTPS